MASCVSRRSLYGLLRRDLTLLLLATNLTRKITMSLPISRNSIVWRKELASLKSNPFQTRTARSVYDTICVKLRLTCFTSPVTVQRNSRRHTENRPPVTKSQD